MPICFKLLPQFMRRAASRANWMAGSSNATKTPMMAMTTSSSTKVKPSRRRDKFINPPFLLKNKKAD
jgi:hypothetical protein